MIEVPVLRRVVEDVAEQFFGLVAGEEVLLVGRLLVGVAGRDHQPVDANLHQLVEHHPDAVGLGAEEKGAVRGHAETARFGRLDGADRHVPDAVAADRVVVILFKPVDVDGEGQVRIRLEVLQLALQQDRVGAEVDELLALGEAVGDLDDVLVDQRFAAGDRHHWRAALLHRVPALLRREPAAQDVGRMLNLAAAGAFEVALQQRLQHQHERVALGAPQPLTNDVFADLDRLSKRGSHM